MTSPVIAGIANDAAARDAVALGVVLAHARDVPLILAAVRGIQREDTVALLDSLTGPMPADLEYDTIELRSPSPVRALHELAAEKRATAVVLGPTHLGKADRAVQGDVTLGMVHASPCAIAVAPPGYGDRRPALPRKLGVAWDGSNESTQALAEAVDFASRHAGRVRLIHVVPDGDPDGAAARLEQAALRAGLRVPAEMVLLQHDPAERLIRISSELDLLVMGSRGLGPAKRLQLGSITRGVLHEARCPVLVLPPGVMASVSR